MLVDPFAQEKKRTLKISHMILTTGADECSSTVQGLYFYFKPDISIFKNIFLFIFYLFIAAK